MFRVLHLSDIHIGATYKDSESIACKVVSDIAHNGLSGIKCIVVTGDIFEGRVTPNDLLINEAVNFFDVLLEEINYNQDETIINKEDVIFVPGNHDLIRVDSLEERWSKYKKFLKLILTTGQCNLNIPSGSCTAGGGGVVCLAC